MDPNNNLQAAIKELTNTGAEIAAPKVREITFKDENGEEHELSVAFLPQGNGNVRAESLLPMVAQAEAHTTRKRLENAIGPDRRKGTAKHLTLQSFIAHMLRFKDEDSAVWALSAGQQATLLGVLNYHRTGADGEPRWGDHRATYACPISDAWERWGAGQPRSFSQEAFAEFLEARDFDLATGTMSTGTVAPTPAHMISMANKLEVYSSATAKRSRDPGTHRVLLSYQEDKGVAGDVQPPPVFAISIPVFTDSEPEFMEVRLKVGIENAKATFTIQIHNAESIWRKSFEKVLSEVILKTGLPVYQGSPE
jgi:uncharacterized protein YfdQ (DUF2303 family)